MLDKLGLSELHQSSTLAPSSESISSNLHQGVEEGGQESVAESIPNVTQGLETEPFRRIQNPDFDVTDSAPGEKSAEMDTDVRRPNLSTLSRALSQLQRKRAGGRGGCDGNSGDSEQDMETVVWPSAGKKSKR